MQDDDNNRDNTQDSPKGGEDKVVRFPGQAAKTRGKMVARDGKRYELTAQQARFAWLVGVEGKNKSDAYREAYNSESMKPSTVWTQACLLSKNEKVAARIAEHRAKQEARAHYDGGYVRKQITSKLLELIDSDTSKTSDKLKAIELLGKLNHVQAFGDKLTIERGVSALSDEEVEALLAEKLRDLAAV